MKKINVKELLDKYFEGLTSTEEERQLRRLFIEGNVPEELIVYRSLFICLDEESRKCKPVKLVGARRFRMRYVWSTIAASVLIVLGIAGYNSFIRQDTNYVIINGEKYNDCRIAKQQAKEALDAVSFSKEDVASELIPEDMKENL